MSKPESSPRPPEPPILIWQKDLLDKRLEAAEKNPDGWLSWGEVREQVFGPSQEKS